MWHRPKARRRSTLWTVLVRDKQLSRRQRQCCAGPQRLCAVLCCAVQEMYHFSALTENQLKAKCEGCTSIKQLRGPASINKKYRPHHTADWPTLFTFVSLNVNNHKLRGLSRPSQAAVAAWSGNFVHFMEPQIRYCLHKRMWLVSVVSQIKPIHTVPTVPLRCILMLPCHLHLGLPSVFCIQVLRRTPFIHLWSPQCVLHTSPI